MNKALVEVQGTQTHLYFLKDEAADPRKDSKSKAEDWSSGAASDVETSNQPLEWESRHKSSGC